MQLDLRHAGRRAPDNKPIATPQYDPQILSVNVGSDLSPSVQELLADPALDTGAINWQDFLGWTPLIYAAFHGDFELVKLV